MPETTSILGAVTNFWLAADTMATWGSLRSTSAIFADIGAPLTPTMMLEFGGRNIRSAPMPFWRCLVSFNMPMKMPAMDRIMMTSMATASTLIMERTGLCTKLAKMSLFIFEHGSEGQKQDRTLQ